MSDLENRLREAAAWEKDKMGTLLYRDWLLDQGRMAEAEEVELLLKWYDELDNHKSFFKNKHRQVRKFFEGYTLMRQEFRLHALAAVSLSLKVPGWAIGVRRPNTVLFVNFYTVPTPFCSLLNDKLNDNYLKPKIWYCESSADEEGWTPVGTLHDILDIL